MRERSVFATGAVNGLRSSIASYSIVDRSIARRSMLAKPAYDLIH